MKRAHGSGWGLLYPIVLAAYPVLHLAAANAGEWIEIGDVLLPLGVTMAVALLAFLWSALLTRDPHKRSVLAVLGILVFSSYGAVLDALSHLPRSWNLDPGPATRMFLLIGGTVITFWVVRSRRPFGPMSTFLATMTLALVPMPIMQILWAQLAARHSIDMPHVSPPSHRALRQLPSVYLIVLDKYTGSESLKSYYNYDNSTLDQALRQRGFVLPAHPHANYSYTRQAMASLLNWKYLDSLVEVMGPRSKDFGPLFELTENNEAMAFMKGMGYEIVYFPSHYPPFRSNRNADVQLPNPKDVSIEFQDVWLRRTILHPLIAVACGVLACDHDPWPRPSASQMDWRFEQLGRLAASKKPRFVIAHLIVPHEPYLYRSDCRHAAVTDFWPDSSARRALYLEQLSCVNKKVIGVIDQILEKSKTPPVILLQSDHGDAHFPKEPLRLEEATPAMVRARFDVLAAYYVPGAPDSLFYDGISPVNLLPRVFNQVFGTRFPRSPDRSYWVIDGSPYDLRPVSRKVLTSGIAPQTHGSN